MKKLFALMLALMMVFGMAAMAAAEDPITITYVATGNVPTAENQQVVLDAINAILLEKLNAKLEIYWIEWTDYVTVYNLLLASLSDQIDLIGTATDWLDAWPNVQKGAFLPLSEEMLAANAPKTYAQVSKEHWDLCKYEGQIYLIPEDNYAQWINHGFIFRQDWATLAGYPDGLHSWEDMEAYFSYCLANKDALGITAVWDTDAPMSETTQLSSGYIQSHGDYIYIDGLSVPLFFAASVEDPYTLTCPYMDDEAFVDFAKLMQKWADAGYWSGDVLNKATENRDEFNQGLVAVEQHHTQTFYSGCYPTMVTNETAGKLAPGWELGFFWFGEESGNLTAMSITHGAMAVAASSQHPELALQVYDLLRNDAELYHLFCYGLEGVNYLIDENGYRYTPADYESTTDAWQSNYWWGRNDSLEIKNAQFFWDGYNKITAAYAETYIDYPYSQLIYDTTKISSYISALSEVYNTWMPVISFGMSGDPEGTVAEFRAELKSAGYDIVFAELQAQLTAFGETYGTK